MKAAYIERYGKHAPPIIKIRNGELRALLLGYAAR
jgi:hypothetical protein